MNPSVTELWLWAVVVSSEVELQPSLTKALINQDSF